MSYDNIKIKEVRVPRLDEIYGSSPIEVIKKNGTLCAIDDYAILLGGWYYGPCVPNDQSLRGRTGFWCLSNMANGKNYDGEVRVVGVSAISYDHYVEAGCRCTGVRPIIVFDDFDDILERAHPGENGLLEVEFGEYPQYVADGDASIGLNTAFEAGTLKTTGKVYTSNSRRYDDESSSFAPTEYPEYEYKGKKYIRVKAQYCEDNIILSNSVRKLHGDYAWIEVAPIEWYVDTENRYIISKILLFSGVRYCDNHKYHGDFKTTEMYMFLNKYFAKEIIPAKGRLYGQKPIPHQERDMINATIADIYDYLNEDYHNSDEVVAEVERIKAEYQEDLDAISQYREKGGLVLADNPMDEKVLFNHLITKLKEVKDKLVQDDAKNELYIQIYHFLDEAISLLDNDALPSEKNDTLDGIYKIREYILPYFENDTHKNELIVMLNSLKVEISNFIKHGEENEISKIKSIRDFNMLMNEKMLLYLARVMADINNTEGLVTVKTKFIKQMTDNIVKSRASYINRYLIEIQEMLTEIDAFGTAEEKANATKIAKEFSDFGDTNEATIKVRKAFTDIYGIIFDIECRQKAQDLRTRYNIPEDAPVYNGKNSK